MSPAASETVPASLELTTAVHPMFQGTYASFARELSNGVDRLKTTGMSALAIAQMVAIATGNQVRIQQAMARTRDVVGNLTVRTSTQIETAASHLDWLNKGVFISVGGRRPGAVVYETYLVG